MSGPRPDRFRLSAATPMFTEEASADAFFDAVLPVLESLTSEFEIVCVDDGSRDATVEKVRARQAAEPRIRLIALTRNFGKEAALSAGLDNAVKQALEGFASGHFALQAEVQRFLERATHFPEDRADGSIRSMTIARLLKKVVYAGYIEARKWNVSLRKRKHEGLISFKTYERIQDNLAGRRRAPAARKDYNEDFPLRGFVQCDHCGNAMTGAWSKCCHRHYAYYRCGTRGCEVDGKSIPRAKLEEGFAEIMKQLQPAKGLFKIAKAMLRDAWGMKLADA